MDFRNTMDEARHLLLSYGDSLQAGLYNLHSTFSRAVNYIREDALVSMVTPEVGGGPANLVLSEIGWRGAAVIRVATDRIEIAGRTVLLTEERRFDSSLPWEMMDIPRCLDNLRSFERIILRDSPPLSFAFLLEEGRMVRFLSAFDRQLATRAAEAHRRLQLRDIAGGVGRMMGTGHGFTPSGDDFVAGWVTGLHFVRRFAGRDTSEEMEVIVRNAETGNPISRSLIRFAFQGRYGERVKNLLLSLLNGSAGDVSRETQRVLAIGETSGADFSSGLLASMKAHLASP